MSKTLTPTNGMTITESVKLARGVFYLPDGIQIGADNITIEGDQTTIVSDVQKNIGIHIRGHNNVTLRNLSITGFYHGVRVDHAEHVTIDNVTVRGTHEIEGIDTFLYLWLPIKKTYGSAILLHDVRDSSIQNCDIQHQMNGILLYHCERIRVEQNNGSFNSGWGVYLSNTSDSVINDNQLDFCNRLFRREDGSIRAEADTAGMVLVKGSSRNQVLRNSCVCGGDGIFLCGYEHPGSFTPCNDNLFEENDCRLSPNNSIESTFSGGNIFRRNDCSRSNYAFWMGYSWDNVLEDNVVEFSRWAGIAIEHAFGFTIRNNVISKNGEGVRLFTRGGPVLEHFPDRKACFDFTIEQNKFEQNTIGFNAYTGDEVQKEQCHDFVLHDNQFVDNRIGAQFNRVQATTLTANTFKDNLIAAVQRTSADDLNLNANVFENNAHDVHEVS